MFSGLKQLSVVSIFRPFCLVGCISLGLFGEWRLIHIAAQSSNDQRLGESSADAFGSEHAFFSPPPHLKKIRSPKFTQLILEQRMSRKCWLRRERESERLFYTVGGSERGWRPATLSHQVWKLHSHPGWCSEKWALWPGGHDPGIIFFLSIWGI